MVESENAKTQGKAPPQFLHKSALPFYDTFNFPFHYESIDPARNREGHENPYHVPCTMYHVPLRAALFRFCPEPLKTQYCTVPWASDTLYDRAKTVPPREYSP